MNQTSPPKSQIRTYLAMAALPLAVLSSESLAWWWNHPSEPEGGRSLLTYVFPPDSKESLRISVPESVMDILSCDGSQSGWIAGGGGSKILVNYFEWNNTERSGLSNAFGHPPEVCMGNLGSEVQAFLPERSFAMDEGELIFDATQFRDENEMPLYIFKLSWAEDMDGLNLLREGPNSMSFRSFQFKSVVERRFPRFARVLMLGVYGAQNDSEAWEIVRGKVLKDLAFHKVRS